MTEKELIDIDGKRQAQAMPSTDFLIKKQIRAKGPISHLNLKSKMGATDFCLHMHTSKPT